MGQVGIVCSITSSCIRQPEEHDSNMVPRIETDIYLLSRVSVPVASEHMGRMPQIMVSAIVQ